MTEAARIVDEALDLAWQQVSGYGPTGETPGNKMCRLTDAARSAVRPERKPVIVEADPGKISRTFIFDRAQVSCANCQHNYPSPSDPEGATSGRWCQAKSFPVDPEDVPACEVKAAECLLWIPARLSRSSCKTPKKPDECWYEKDSMG